MNNERSKGATLPTMEDFERLETKVDQVMELLKGLQPSIPDEWVETKDAMQMLKISEKTLYNWRRDNEIPYYQHGKLIRYKRQDILDKMKEMHITVKQ
jgi:excisionase family DNA binding protein